MRLFGELFRLVIFLCKCPYDPRPANIFLDCSRYICKLLPLSLELGMHLTAKTQT